MELLRCFLEIIVTCKISSFDKTSKVLDATKGELFSRLQAPDNLQGSGCRVQFGEESFLTRFFIWICKKNDRLFSTRTVFGTTEDKINRQGQDLYIININFYSFDFYLVTDYAW